MTFTIKTRNAFEMTGREAACETTASSPERRAFVQVCPPWPQHQRSFWFIRRYEVPANYLTEGVSVWDGNMLNKIDHHVSSIEQVEEILQAWGVDSSRLDAPWKCDIPT